MKSSLMVEDDRMCTCQEGNQLKLKKKKEAKKRSETKERCEKQEKDSSLHVTSGYLCNQSLMRENQSFMDLCV